MVGKYKSLEPKFPSGRLEDKGLYRKVMQLYFAGYPSVGISQHLKMTPQSVNRILRRIRTRLVLQKRFHSFMIDEALKVGFYQVDLYVWLNHGAYSTATDANPDMLKCLRQCYYKCPRALGPDEFIKKFVDITYDDQNFPYPISPELKLGANIDEIFDEFGRRHSCASCPIGQGRKNLFKVFVDYPEVYVDVMFYLYQNRIRGVDEFFYHISIATYISAMRRIANLRMIKCRQRGIDNKTADRIVTRKLVRMIDAAYEFLAMPPSDFIDMKGGFVYSDGTGTSND